MHNKDTKRQDFPEKTEEKARRKYNEDNKVLEILQLHATCEPRRYLFKDDN